MENHTPSPWQVASNANGKKVIIQHNGKTIATARGKNSEANAPLIAAGPYLLVACKEALDIIECNCGEPCQGTCTHAVLTRAVAKVE